MGPEAVPTLDEVEVLALVSMWSLFLVFEQCPRFSSRRRRTRRTGRKNVPGRTEADFIRPTT